MTGVPSRKDHVLIVDDDPLSRKLARVLLEQSGFDVTEAENGEVALEHLNGGRSCDLMLIDLNMPKLNGQKVLQRVRASPATAQLPVVVLSGSRTEEAMEPLLHEGADDYVCKPIDPPSFAARITAALARAREERHR